MPKLMVDRTGQRYGRLVAVEPTKIVLLSGRASTAWKCNCDCGGLAVVHADHLRSGKTRSCGCGLTLSYARNAAKGRVRDEPEYGVYSAMLRRCYNPKAFAYAYYGGRGVTVCDRWRFGADARTGYECFMEDMGVRPDGLTLDRIDPFGNYEPGNCRWADRVTQARNQRRYLVG